MNALAKRLPTDYDMACDDKLPKTVRAEAWRRHEGNLWLQAYLYRGLKIKSLEFQFQTVVQRWLHDHIAPLKAK